jgi:Sec-independent protein translocase protein TatA
MGALGFAKDLVQGHTSRYKDIYVNGESEPRMIATKMLQGHYRDQKTNKVISRVQDIDGAVIDETGNVVLTEADIAKGLYDKFKKPIAMRLYDLGSKVLGFIGAPYKLAFDLLRSTVPKVIAYAKAHKDIYVAGETEPRMLARLIRQGYYKRQLDGKVITGIKDISGVIVDPTGNVVLTTEDINKGLVDKNGNPIRTIGEKLGSLAGMGFKLAGKGIKMLGKGLVNAMSFMKNFFGQGWDVIKGMLGGFSLLGYSKPIKDELVKIRTILDERLPGKKKRRLLGDADGDGTREGSAADQAAKRDAAEAKGEGRNFRKMLAGLFSRNKDGKDGKKGMFEGLGLKTLLGGLLGGVGGLIKSITGLIPGFGLISKALGFLGKGLGGAAKLAWGATKLGVKGALGVGRLAIQGAGWAAGGMASMMGFSGVGAMLGAAASGVGAILASPVVLTAAAIAAVGYAAIKIYKYVTRPRSWLTQFRMVQYGFKPRDNDELLSKIVTLENLLLKVVNVSDKSPATTGNGVKLKEIYAIFGVDENDEEQLKEFIAWYQYRFKPIFLTHCTILYQVTKKLDLQTIDDDLDTAQKLDYILKTHFPNDDKSPYHVGASPFKDEKIQESAADVAEAIRDYRKLIQKDKDEQDAKIKEKKRREALTPDQRAKEDAAKKAEEQKSWYNKSKEGASALAQAGMDKLRAAKELG